MQQLLGQEAQRLGQFIGQMAQRVQSLTLVGSQGSSFINSGDLLGTGIGVLFGSVFYFAGGAFSGYQDAGIKGAVVFTATTWLFSSMQERISTGPQAKFAPVMSAVGLYLASQCFMGMF